MTDSPDRDRQWSRGGGEEPTQAFGSHPGYTDPAYAGQTPYGSPYQPPYAPPTQHLPGTAQQGWDPYQTGPYPPGGGYGPPQPPEDPRPPRWLWIVAGAAVVTIIGLVIALVVVNSSRQQTVVAPVPTLGEPGLTTTRPSPPATTSRTPVIPLPTLPTTPSTTPEPSTTPVTPGATDTVVYTVSGTGRVINITYVDSGGVLQTEFNVLLPWTREVSLAQPAGESASVSVINVGRRVTCSISVDNVEVQQQTGVGLTVCAPTR
jgi:hypothetical protein